MIYLISCGISKPDNCQDMSPIPCVSSDARKVFTTFNLHIRDFCVEHSIVLLDVKKRFFLEFLEETLGYLTDKDILVVYFTGHGQINKNQGLNILLRDSYMSSSILMDTLVSAEKHVVLILDCCHAGAALHITNMEDVMSRNTITVIASCTPLRLAKYDKMNSTFTRKLCESIEVLDVSNEDITIVSLVKKIKALGYSQVYSRVEIGKTDLLLQSGNTEEKPIHFTNIFLNKIKVDKNILREIMWYALGNSSVGYITQYSVLNQFFLQNYYEGSWFVRRAIGSLISNLPQSENNVIELEKKLIDSPSWIQVCIGLVATRYENNDKIKDIRKNICESDRYPMDAIWLANLYFSDYNNEEGFFPNNMLKSSWGVIDLYCRYAKKPKIINEFEKIIPYTYKQVLEKHKRLLNVRNLQDNSLAGLLYNNGDRGRTPINDKDKWLHSVLFGKWRDYRQANLDEYFINTPNKQLVTELKGAFEIPQIDCKIALLDYISVNEELKEKYKNYLKWGLKDEHPWVRRSAIKIYDGELNLLKDTAFYDRIDMDIYPGVLDLIIEGAALSRDRDWHDFLKSYIEKYDFTIGEKKALMNYI